MGVGAERGPETRHVKDRPQTRPDVASPEFHGRVMALKRNMRERGFNPPYWLAKRYTLGLEEDNYPTPTTIEGVVDEMNDRIRQLYVDDLRRIDEITEQNPTMLTPQDKERLMTGRLLVESGKFNEGGEPTK